MIKLTPTKGGGLKSELMVTRGMLIWTGIFILVIVIGVLIAFSFRYLDAAITNYPSVAGPLVMFFTCACMIAVVGLCVAALILLRKKRKNKKQADS